MRVGSEGKVVVITGGSSGIGLATAMLFARRGWRVGLIARSVAGLAAAESALNEYSARVCTCAADVTDAAALEAAAGLISLALGPILVWVNAAGNGVFGALSQVSAREFDRVTATTYTGTVNGVRVALAQMSETPVGRGGSGAIVNVCSAMAFRGLPGMSSYAGAKAAVRGFTESVQTELKLAGSFVRLAIVYPPAVNTPFFAHAVSHFRLPPRPAKPVYQPEMVAEGIYLAATRKLTVLRLSFVTVVFDLACRLAPGLVGRAIGRLGYEGQMTDLVAAHEGRDPCLFEPPLRVTGTRGPFPARGWSAQLWLRRHRVAVAGGVAAVTVLLIGRWLIRDEPLRCLPD